MKRCEPRVLYCLIILCSLIIAISCSNPSGGGSSDNNGKTMDIEPVYFYVVPGGSGLNKGVSWENALGDVQEAINEAVRSGGKNYVLVMEGTYHPTSSPNYGGSGRFKHFALKNNVTVIGGFDGNEAGIIPSGDQTKTILSGDLNDNKSFDNNDVYHVFYHPSGLNNTAVLQNVTISGGNANGDWDNIHKSGGGMYNNDSNPTIINCIFSGNYAAGYGGAISNQNSNPTISRCTFSGNSTADGGGAIYNLSSDPTISDCTFSGNTAYAGGGMYNSSGGGTYNLGSSPIITNCTFNGNSVDQSGGAMYNDYRSNPILTNCTIVDNSAGFYGGGGMYNYGQCEPIIINCTFSGNSASNAGGALFNESSSYPKVYGTIMIGNSPSEYAGDALGADVDNLLSGTVNAVFSNIQGGKAVLDNYGGSTKTVKILTGNTDICLSSKPSWPGVTVPAKDQRGYTRTSTGFYLGAMDPSVNP